MKATVHQLRPTSLAVARRVQNYRWEEGIDPAMTEICDLIVQSGLSIHEITKRVTSVSNGQVKTGWGTIDNWLSGKTKRPQNFTLTWVG
jgi:hypothetical protein